MSWRLRLEFYIISAFVQNHPKRISISTARRKNGKTKRYIQNLQIHHEPALKIIRGGKINSSENEQLDLMAGKQESKNGIIISKKDNLNRHSIGINELKIHRLSSKTLSSVCVCVCAFWVEKLYGIVNNSIYTNIFIFMYLFFADIVCFYAYFVFIYQMWVYRQKEPKRKKKKLSYLSDKWNEVITQGLTLNSSLFTSRYIIHLYII